MRDLFRCIRKCLGTLGKCRHCWMPQVLQKQTRTCKQTQQTRANVIFRRLLVSASVGDVEFERLRRISRFLMLRAAWNHQSIWILWRSISKWVGALGNIRNCWVPQILQRQKRKCMQTQQPTRNVIFCMFFVRAAVGDVASERSRRIPRFLLQISS